MKNSILIENMQIEDDISEKLKQYISSILYAKGIENSSLNIVFISEHAIHDMNREYRDKDTPTDVITFSMLEGNCTEFSGNMLGDIYICPQCIDGQGIKPLIRRVFHGLLHILGNMHETDEDNDAFVKMENDLIDEFFRGIDD